MVDTVTTEMVMPNGEIKLGEDNGGVLRDCVSQFWIDFYNQCTIGKNIQDPNTST